METKKKKSKFRYIIYLLFIIFGLLYFANITGYYENRIASNSRLTKEAIMEFEKDVSEGKAVDIKDYVENTHHNYQNNYSNLGYEISNAIDIALNEGVGYLFKILKALFG